jgi:hypothetical protein
LDVFALLIKQRCANNNNFGFGTRMEIRQEAIKHSKHANMNTFFRRALQAAGRQAFVTPAVATQGVAARAATTPFAAFGCVSSRHARTPTKPLVNSFVSLCVCSNNHISALLRR